MASLMSQSGAGAAQPGVTYWMHPDQNTFEPATNTNYRQAAEGGEAAGGRMLDGSEVNARIARKQDEAFQARVNALTQPRLDEMQRRLDEQLSKEKTYNSLAEQIKALTGGDSGYTAGGAAGPGLQNNLQASNMQFAGGTPTFNEQTGTYNAVAGGIQQLAGGKTDPALLALSAERNYGASPLAAKMNFQVSDDQILNDYNTAKVDRYKRVVELGNTQAVGIQERLTAAQKLLDTLPANSAQRTSSDVYVDGLKKDLASVRSAVSDATSQIGSFKPLAVGSTDAAKEITSFRSFLQLPEERASQQLYQIDPDAYRTSVALGQRYRQMAETPIGATTTPETEQLRKTIGEEAINQLRLGSTIGAEERRGYEQAIRGAQTARGNIFGLGPAVQEASQIGAAGEQRKLARYGAAQAFLGSGQTTGDALKADLAFRDALQQNRLGAASGFIAGGPSIGNLAQARTGQQQAAFQNYIQANQALPGGFNQQPSTAAPFYQAVDQNIPVALTQAFNDLYRSQANYLSDTYGAQTRAQASTYTSPSQAFGNVASGLGNLFSFSKAF